MSPPTTPASNNKPIYCSYHIKPSGGATFINLFHWLKMRSRETAAVAATVATSTAKLGHGRVGAVAGGGGWGEGARTVAIIPLKWCRTQLILRTDHRG